MCICRYAHTHTHTYKQIYIKVSISIYTSVVDCMYLSRVVYLPLLHVRTCMHAYIYKFLRT